MGNRTFRFASADDVPLIQSFVRGLAEYERMESDMVADDESVRHWLFDEKCARVLFVLEDGREVGFALFFYNYSTFLGRAGIYLEDLFVLPAYRGRGHGKALIARLAKIATEQGCGRLEWSCLDWNLPSIEFYLSLGARKMDEWTVYRLTGETLKRVADFDTDPR